MSKNKKKVRRFEVPQPKEFRQMDGKVTADVAAMCPNSQWALKYLLSMFGEFSYGFNIRYLMDCHEERIIDEDDMVHLCRAVRYCYGMVPNPLEEAS